MQTMLRTPSPDVAQNPRFLLQATDILRDDAAIELGTVLSGITGKQLTRAGVPTCGSYAISRAVRGGDNNPLYRIACLFVAMKRLGIGRDKAQRVVNWLQEIIDSVYGAEAETTADLQDILESDQEQDPRDDLPRYRAALGCAAAARELLDVKRDQVAIGTVVILALRRHLSEVAG